MGLGWIELGERAVQLGECRGIVVAGRDARVAQQRGTCVGRQRQRFKVVIGYRVGRGRRGGAAGLGCHRVQPGGNR